MEFHFKQFLLFKRSFQIKLLRGEQGKYFSLFAETNFFFNPHLARCEVQAMDCYAYLSLEFFIKSFKDVSRVLALPEC